MGVFAPYLSPTRVENRVILVHTGDVFVDDGEYNAF